MNGDFNNIPVIIGTNRNEGTTFVYGTYLTSMSATLYSTIVNDQIPAAYVDGVLALYPPLSVILVALVFCNI